ncbi:MAG: DNA repair exonuclease [bacterium]|nr:DNA repair exonuclease [bacterium]
MKFLHTGDWQVGMKATHTGPAGERVREERLAAARRVVELARSEGVEFILLAGDTFEDNAVDRVMVQRVVDILAKFGGPVYVIPGNHDPLTPGSVWEHPAWASASNIRVLRKAEPVEIPGGVLFPCPVFSKNARLDPTAWIQAGQLGGIRIGIAHGTVGNIHQEEPFYPVPADAAVRCGLDYLALGHWHSTTLYPDAGGAVRMAYSGTYEQTRFGERDSGNALIVEVPGPGERPVVRSVPVGGLRWEAISEILREAGDLARIRERVERLERPEAMLLDILITGFLPADDRGELQRLEEVVAAKFLFGRVNSSGVLPSPADESWVAGLPAGVIRQAAERLRAMADPENREARPEGVTPAIAARALLELYALQEGGGK